MTSPIPPDQTVASRVVIRAPNWLGDAVLALPAMAAIRRHFKDAHLAVAAPAGFADLFRERIFFAGETGTAPDEVIALPAAPAAIRAAFADGHFDVGILFPNSFRSARLFKQAGIRERWGYRRAFRGPWLTRSSASRPSAGVQHQADYYRNLVRGFGIPVDEDAPRIGLTDATLARGLDLVRRCKIDTAKRIIVLAPGAAYGQAKQWPPARVAEMAARLIRDRDATCVMVGAGHDRDAARAVESSLPDSAGVLRSRLVDLTGQTSLPELMGVIERADAVVANDSGAMHLAAALGRPVVAIFGPTDERATRPVGPTGQTDVLTANVFCRPCHLRDCPIDHRCIKRVTADMVFAAVSRQLAFRRESVRESS
jgi:heptosyltransferase-2